MGERVYLDYNATAPMHPMAVEAMQHWLSGPHNASSVHHWGREARGILEKSRGIIADSLGVEPAGVIFTSCGTEANNQILRGIQSECIIASGIEHSSIMNMLKQESDKAVFFAPVTADGCVDSDALKALLEKYQDKQPLVSVMMANNETGVIQPIAEIAELAHGYGALVHCDAAQAYGKLPFTMQDVGADILTIAGHKCGGPVGTAAIVINSCIPLAPLLLGGGQELNRRAGTENIPGIAGFAAAVEQFDAIYEQLEKVAGWRDAMEAALMQTAPDMTILGQRAVRLPQTSCMSMPGGGNALQTMHFDLEGFAVSSGSACTSGKVGHSHVLTAMGATADVAETTIRVSGGWGSKESDYQTFTRSWQQLYTRLHGVKGEAAA